MTYFLNGSPLARPRRVTCTRNHLKHQCLISPPELTHTVWLSDQRRADFHSVCVCMCVSPSQQLLCQHPLSPTVGLGCKCGVVEEGGRHTAWLKNSSTTPGAALCLVCGMMRCRLSLSVPARTHTHSNIHTNMQRAERTRINSLSAFIQQMCLLPTRTGCFLTGVKIQELVMRKQEFDLL